MKGKGSCFYFVIPVGARKSSKKRSQAQKELPDQDELLVPPGHLNLIDQNRIDEQYSDSEHNLFDKPLEEGDFMSVEYFMENDGDALMVEAMVPKQKILIVDGKKASCYVLVLSGKCFLICSLKILWSI